MAAIQGVLFDLDNTLAHRDLSIARYAVQFAQHYHARLRDASAHDIATLIVARDNGGYGVPGSLFATVREDIAATLATRLRWHGAPSTDELVRHWFEHFAAHSVEMPGASALLDRLAAAGMPVGIVSNGKESTRRALVRHLGFDRRSAILVSSERAGVKKPDARIFALAAAELGVPADRCCFVGDHPVNDVAGAHGAGMHAVWLEGFHAWPTDAERATTIAALHELEPLLR